jgi:hypothetical protein
VAHDTADDVLDEVLAAGQALGRGLDADFFGGRHRRIACEEVGEPGGGEDDDQGDEAGKQLEQRLHRGGQVLRDHSASTAGERVSMCH